MDDKFFTGIALGMLGGVILATNSLKTRKMVQDGQEQVLEKVSKMSGGKSKKSSQTE